MMNELLNEKIVNKMTKAAYQVLKNSDWFRELPEEIIELLVQKVQTHHLKPEDILIQKGNLDDSVFLIQDGWVKIVIPDDDEGGEMVLNHVGPSQMVGELSLVDRRPRSASVIAIEDLIALELTRDDFLEVMEEYPLMGLHMLITMSNRMRFVLTYVEQAMLWSQKIAEGDYSFLEEFESATSSIVDDSGSDMNRATRFLKTFFKMAEDVQEREQALIEEVQRLYIQIDTSKRDVEIENITGSDFFERLKSDTIQLRKQRKTPKAKG